MSAPLSASAQRVQDFLDAQRANVRIVEYAQTARTSQEAAALLGCDVAQIAKSIIFRVADSVAGVLVIASGANRVDEKKVATRLNVALAKADADFVRAATGYAIGGVPPVAHATALRVLIDQDLLNYETVFAAGGTPNALFPIAPGALVELAHAIVADIKQATH